ncbi:MAG: acyl carrier protein [Anaerolineae bacterium]
MSIETLIRSYILENFLFTDDNGRLQNDTSFLEEGIVDSTGVLELVMFVEETFGTTVEDEEIVPENFDSVEQLARYVRLKVRKAAVPSPGERVPAR